MSFRRRLMLSAVAMLIAVATTIVWRSTWHQPILIAQASTRAIEARLSDPRVDRWRPCADAPREDVRVDLLAKLEKRGDWRSLGDACLLDGQLDRAAFALSLPNVTAEVESDRAALALQQHHAVEALTHATRALQLAPGYPQAAWNRALALRDLGLVLVAADAFAAIATRGEPGWSNEARTRALAIRAAVARSHREYLEANAAGQAMAETGEPPAMKLVRAQPQLMWGYLEIALAKVKDARRLRALVPVAEAIDPNVAARVRLAAEGGPRQAMHDGGPDPLLALRLLLEQGNTEVHDGHAAQAEQGALRALAEAGAIGADLPRQYLVLLSAAADAQGDKEVADAAVDEARLVRNE